MFFILDAPFNFWIVGHAYVFWAQKRAEWRVYGNNLGLPYTGMRWSNLHPVLSHLHDCWPIPWIIILHLSANDLGKRKTFELISQIKLDLFCLHAILTDTFLVFSEMIPQIDWLLCSQHKYLEKNCKQINRALDKFMPSVHGLSFRHVDLESSLPGFYRPDNMHLSDIALDILNLDFQTCVELAVAVVGCQAL